MMRIPFSPVFLPLSPVWKRPSNALSTMKLVFASPDLRPHHIRQNIVSDCSVCSSIAVCLNHHKTFNSKVKHSHSSIQQAIYRTYSSDSHASRRMSQVPIPRQETIYIASSFMLMAD